VKFPKFAAELQNLATIPCRQTEGREFDTRININKSGVSLLYFYCTDWQVIDNQWSGRRESNPRLKAVKRGVKYRFVFAP
jgi:hypothetical protein